MDFRSHHRRAFSCTIHTELTRTNRPYLYSIGLSLFNHFRTDISKPTPTLGLHCDHRWIRTTDTRIISQ